MIPLVLSCVVALVPHAAGLSGSLVGVGGAIITVPLLTLLLGGEGQRTKPPRQI